MLRFIAEPSNSRELLKSGLDGLVGVVELLLQRVEHRLDLVGGVADAPQGAALVLHGPPGDEVLGDRAGPEHRVELAGDTGLLGTEDLDVGPPEDRKSTRLNYSHSCATRM